MIARTPIAPLAALFALALGSVFTTAVAHAATNGGSVKGTISLGKAKRKYPVESEGFVQRKPNPIRELKPYDPRKYVVVVLVDGEIAEEDKAAPRHGAKWELLGGAFEYPLIAVQAGTAIDIKNTGRNKPQLYSPDEPEVVDPEPLSPGGVRSVRVKDSFRAVRIFDHDSAHLEGIVVAFPSPYFSLVDDNGNYEIKGVPPGRWTVRVWYRDGWLIQSAKVHVDVAARRPTKADTITLPEPIKTEAPSAGAAEEDKGA